MRLQDKVVVVTGGGNGIGRELVLELLRRGARVAAVDISEPALTETAALAGSGREFQGFVVDLTQRADVEALPERVIDRFGAVDAIINNAGIIQPFVRLNDLEYAVIERVLGVNLYGTLYMVKSFLPHLLQRPEAHIANVSSMGGFLPVPGQTMYGAAKAAVKLMTEGLTSELQDTAVGVTLVLPGAIGTNITANSGLSDSLLRESAGEAQRARVLAPDAAARIILTAIERGRDRVFVGTDVRLMDKVYRVSPRRAARMVYEKMRRLLPA